MNGICSRYSDVLTAEKSNLSITPPITLWFPPGTAIVFSGQLNCNFAVLRSLSGSPLVVSDQRTELVVFEIGP